MAAAGHILYFGLELQVISLPVGDSGTSVQTLCLHAKKQQRSFKQNLSKQSFHCPVSLA